MPRPTVMEIALPEQSRMRAELRRARNGSDYLLRRSNAPCWPCSRLLPGRWAGVGRDGAAPR